ncbi:MULTISPECIES: dihydroxyacetone kinase phosphoryl donor subunit DhaM [Actinomadura]|uniref:phosphoenolpyruvate--glycerone phosphotransferase n=1 Tax=Actinomadura madurae TaxID=1993 RepID=A0A1I5T0P5_9ACTN|nr:dihydroxyacetone kinase phosphoryl donor subunit DhaM [Actinomadura madurae]SFP76016.1 dihydroxyacetone kinase, phosphotransfer subunit [Actinomadura madurae]SPT59666.1 PTS-dependent dihydroxyacetone kinase, phosphotransferase subunit dhaM [Actinomadura madurae]
MVGIVIISHSPTLAEGAAEVARAMGIGKAVVEPAGGDTEGRLGTSIDLVEHAVAAADGGDGVVLIADIGSSVLTGEMLIEDAERDDVLFADAPMVEGAVAAASMAATGADLAAVHAAAESARDHRKTG